MVIRTKVKVHAIVTFHSTIYGTVDMCFCSDAIYYNAKHANFHNNGNYSACNNTFDGYGIEKDPETFEERNSD